MKDSVSSCYRVSRLVNSDILFNCTFAVAHTAFIVNMSSMFFYCFKSNYIFASPAAAAVVARRENICYATAKGRGKKCK